MSEAFDTLVREVNSSPPERKLIELIERTNLSADLKAILCDLARLTIRVSGKVIAIGRRILAFALDLIRAFPAMAMGAVVALVVASVIDSIPVLGNKHLMAILTPLLLAMGIGMGALQDMSSPDFRERVSALVDSFRALVIV
ncbi:hypothetical protein [uncultured Paracoccus sp.]|jgi:hypothetical protein|uniref:hypothetical protein n=1 Tax=uncultured Paracoccus sp. TaxID=189685 RepID=UPI002629F900|nr:hypothetical protein [uncultured Paracoccus sp.]